MAGRKPKQDDVADIGADTLDSLISGAENVERGGKTGSDNDAPENVQFTDPATLTETDEYERDKLGNLVYGKSGEPRRKRGRKGGRNTGGTGTSRGNSKGKTRNNSAVDSLSATLLLFHSTLANFAKIEELELDKQESDMLAASLANVMDEFDIVPDPKIAAIVGLVGTASIIYGPRVALYRIRTMKRAKAANPAPEKPAENEGKIFPFTGFDATGAAAGNGGLN